MIDTKENDNLRTAFVALRTAIKASASSDGTTVHKRLRALSGLEQAALNAPQNRGWLRDRQIELRDTLDALDPDTHAPHANTQLQDLYKQITAFLQTAYR